MQLAARVAKVFQIDPIIVLDDKGDEFVTLVRLACAQVIQNDEKKQAEQSKARGRRR